MRWGFCFLLILVGCSPPMEDREKVWFFPQAPTPLHPNSNFLDELFNLHRLISEELVSARKSPLNLGFGSDEAIYALKDADNFYPRIQHFVQSLGNPHHAKIHPTILRLYGVDQPLSQRTPVGLISHKMCVPDRDSLKKIMGPRRAPSNLTLQRIQNFAKRHNVLRSRVIQPEDDFEKQLSREALQLQWGALFGCLAKKESLGDPDSNQSYEVARSHPPAGFTSGNFEKPRGVKFYWDHRQSNPKSRLNIGLYQFAPDPGGNIMACLDYWDENYYRGGANLSDLNQRELISVLASEKQNFNAFCGVKKIAESFYIQVNTRRIKSGRQRTFPGNEKLMPQNRCVSPHFHASYAYNHFGPLQNSTGQNLNELMSCVYDRIQESEWLR